MECMVNGPSGQTVKVLKMLLVAFNHMLIVIIFVHAPHVGTSFRLRRSKPQFLTPSYCRPKNAQVANKYKRFLEVHWKYIITSSSKHGLDAIPLSKPHW